MFPLFQSAFPAEKIRCSAADDLAYSAFIYICGSVRQVRGLSSVRPVGSHNPAFFRFYLTVDTFAFD